MTISNSGINHIIIGTDTYYNLGSENNIIFIDNETNIEKQITTSAYTNIRYTEWEFNIVNDINDENLEDNDIYLSRGFYTLEIYNENEKIYTNILFIDINKNIISSIDDDEIIYTIDD